MDYTVSWWLEALTDIYDIASYIARDSAFYAKVVVKKSLEKIRRIANIEPSARSTI